MWAQNDGSIYKEDFYIDGFEAIGKLERSKSPVAPETANTKIAALFANNGITPQGTILTSAQKKEFVVATSRMKTTLAETELESRSLRKLENQMLVTSGSFKNYY